MHLLIESMETKVELRTATRLTISFYDALQSYCENLGEELVEFLPTLMSKLMTIEVQCNSSLKLQRLIVSTFSSIVCSVKSNFNPYFDFAVQIVKPYLSYNQLQVKQDETKLLQIECIGYLGLLVKYLSFCFDVYKCYVLDLMGVFAKNIGKEKFTDVYVENCLSFVENVLGNENDPEIRSAA